MLVDEESHKLANPREGDRRTAEMVEKLIEDRYENDAFDSYDSTSHGNILTAMTVLHDQSPKDSPVRTIRQTTRFFHSVRVLAEIKDQDAHAVGVWGSPSRFSAALSNGTFWECENGKLARADDLKLGDASRICAMAPIA